MTELEAQQFNYVREIIGKIVATYNEHRDYISDTIYDQLDFKDPDDIKVKDTAHRAVESIVDDIDVLEKSFSVLHEHFKDK